MSKQLEPDLRVVLVDRGPFGNAVGGAGARENDATDTVVRQRLEQGQRTGDVVALVLGRILHRLADVRVLGEVHDRLGAVPRDHGSEALAVRDVAHFKRAPADGFAMAVDEVVVGNGGVPRLRPCLAGMAACLTSIILAGRRQLLWPVGDG